MSYLSVVDLGTQEIHAPSGPKFLHSHAVLGKIGGHPPVDAGFSRGGTNPWGLLVYHGYIKIHMGSGTHYTGQGQPHPPSLSPSLSHTGPETILGTGPVTLCSCRRTFILISLHPFCILYPSFDYL